MRHGENFFIATIAAVLAFVVNAGIIGTPVTFALFVCSPLAFFMALAVNYGTDIAILRRRAKYTDPK